ncbi:MAG: winged helix-turn-helix domain-containing protein [Gemmataceae bacterium]|nr:winged helix-turn-helix domain-containing protein [Gemmataceae bacterium]
MVKERSEALGMPSSAELLALVDAIKYPVRVRIMVSLAASPKSVSSVAQDLRIRPDTASHHLGWLHDCGIVQFRKNKNWHLYRLSDLVRVEVLERMYRICMGDPRVFAVVFSVAKDGFSQDEGGLSARRRGLPRR